ncbi:MAG: N-acetyl-alpha-D-glucosaminyl L-malate synthase BshA [Planctomycetes bacterium]|nr:N-acetyl-alpha-D-glucosaminyl L-malate synthase BshA [Planctomycetota bacterium]
MPTDDSMRREPVAILCYPTIGGSGRIACQLAKGLAARGHDVRVVSYEEPVFLDPSIRFERVAVLDYPLLRYPPYDQALAARICELHEQHGIRLFHAHYAIPHAVAVLLADAMLGGNRLRLVTTLHGTDISVVGRDPAYRRAVQWALERSDAVTAVSASLAAQTRSEIGFDGAIDVVPNFVDTEVFRPGAGPRWVDRPFDEPRRIVHLSTFRPVKRAWLLVEVLAELAKVLPFEVDMVGTGPDLDAARALARERGIENRLRFVGSEANPARYLQSADLFVFASATESFGLGILEALACRVPVVGPAVGGVPEVLGDPAAGILVEESPGVGGVDATGRVMGDVSATEAFVRSIASGMAELLLDADAYRATAARGPERATSVFPFDRALEAYLALYQRVEARRS